jgi:dipeptidase
VLEELTGNHSCTTILVGKAATVDGSVLMATSCDGNIMGHVYMLPAKEYPGDARVRMFYDFPAPSTWAEHEDQLKKGILSTVLVDFTASIFSL